MARTSSYISIFQIDAGIITLFRCKRSARAVDPVVFEIDSGSPEASEAARRIKALIKKHKAQDDAICLLLPRHLLTTRVIVLPSQNPEELAGMVRLSAGEYVPYPPHEIVVDHAILQRHTDGHSRVLAVFAHRDAVEDQVATLRSAGLEPSHVFVSTACLAAAAIEARKGNDERFALVHLAPGGLEIVILNGGRLEYSRGVAVAERWPEDVKANPEAMEELAVEVRASLSAYRRESEDGAGVDFIYVSSDCVHAVPVAEALAEITGFDVAPARFAQTLVTHHDALAGFLPMATLGAAMAAQDRAAVRVALVPESMQRRRKQAAMRKNLVRAGVFAVVVLVALGSIYGYAYTQRSSYIAELQSRISAVQPIADDVTAKRRQLMRLQQHLDRKESALELLVKLVDLMPASGMNITEYSFTHGEEIRLRGRAETQWAPDNVAEAARREGRESNPIFSQAGTGQWRREQEYDQEVYDYEIIIPFPKDEPAGAESDEESTDDFLE